MYNDRSRVMKRTERQHLKENEMERFAREARELLERRRRETTVLVAVVAVVAIVALGYLAWRQQVQSKASALLAQAMAAQDARVGPPGMPGAGLTFPTERERAQAAQTKFKAAADAYPKTDAGIYARYQEAGEWMILDNPKEAARAYQDVIDHAGSSGIYGQMARLGLAEAQARQGQYEQAINTFKDMAQRKDGPLPVDGILMQLGRTYLEAGKPADARQTFTRLVDEYPESPFSGDARRELDTLKKTT
jgi:TolA-binding protein